ETVNDAWRRISRATGIPVICTNDCHYVSRSDARAHEILMCIQQGKTVTDERRMHHKTDAYYIKSPSEMNAYFKDIPAALENAARVGADCNVELELGQVHLPRYRTPEDEDLESYLSKVARAGLDERLAELRARGRRSEGARPFEPDEYRQRL